MAGDGFVTLRLCCSAPPRTPVPLPLPQGQDLLWLFSPEEQAWVASWLAQANITEGIWMGLGQAPAGRLRWSTAQVGWCRRRIRGRARSRPVLLPPTPLLRSCVPPKDCCGSSRASEAAASALHTAS